jgi:hypothetical protein
MKTIAAIALLSAITSIPAYAGDHPAHVLIKTETSNISPEATRRLFVERIESLSKFSFVQNDNFSLYGKLSFSRINREDVNEGMHHKAPTYGLHGHFVDNHKMRIHFGWDRCLAGQDTCDNIYSLTAVFKF